MRQRELLGYGEAPVVVLLWEALLRDANLDAAVLRPTQIGRVRFNRLGVCIPMRRRGAEATFDQRLRRIGRTGLRELFVRGELLRTSWPDPNR